MDEKKNEKAIRNQIVETQLGVLAQEEQSLKETLVKLESQKWNCLREIEHLKRTQEATLNQYNYSNQA